MTRKPTDFEFVKAEALRCTLEGRQCEFSVELFGDELLLRAKRIERGAKPQLELVAAILRSAVPLSPQVRAVLADFFTSRPIGRPSGETWYREAAERYGELRSQKVPSKQAKYKVAKEFGITERQVKGAYSVLLEVRRIQSEVNRE